MTEAAISNLASALIGALSGVMLPYVKFKSSARKSTSEALENFNAVLIEERDKYRQQVDEVRERERHQMTEEIIRMRQEFQELHREMEMEKQECNRKIAALEDLISTLHPNARPQ